jgi:predicted GIY-YIG superfamily endonuclease
MKYKLYRHYDRNETLLYVGISANVFARIAGHKSTSKWFDDIAKITIENYESYAEVLEAEASAILSEKPLYNIKNSVVDYRNETKDNAVLIRGADVIRILGVSSNRFYVMLKRNEFIPSVGNLKPPYWRKSDVLKFLAGRDAEQ